MKEVFRHYGGSVIAVLAGTILLALAAGLPYHTVSTDPGTCMKTLEGQAFENYWRCR